MSDFGFEQRKYPFPHVETANAKWLEPTVYPKWKYHAKYPQGVIIQNAEEDEMLNEEGWVDSLTALGIETHPSVDPADKVQVRLAEIRAQMAAAQAAE